MGRPGPGADHPPAIGANRLHPPGQPVAGSADSEVAHGPDHEEQTEGVTDEPRDADHHPAYEDDKPVEQLPGGHLTAAQPLLGMSQYPEADAPDDKRAERTDHDEKPQCPEEADLVDNGNEGHDLGGNEHQHTKKDHSAG